MVCRFSFKYDPFGRRIEKISPTTTSIFAYDGDGLIETVNGSGSLVARYAQGPGIDQPLAMQRGTTTDYYEADGLASVTSLSSSTGTLAQTYTYDSFGNTTNSSGSLTNFFRYTGREFDTETDLYYNRARYLPIDRKVPERGSGSVSCWIKFLRLHSELTRYFQRSVWASTRRRRALRRYRRAPKPLPRIGLAASEQRARHTLALQPSEADASSSGLSRFKFMGI
jgi:hypothetical protein